VPIVERVKHAKRAFIGDYSKPDGLIASSQVLSTFVPIGLLWWAVARGAAISVWIPVAIVPVLALFTLRAFTLMHDCGHDSLFRNRALNRAFGFALGVLTGMPQYVWSKHHNFHHAHNGNWEKYRGPYSTRSVAEYEAMSEADRSFYRRKCSIGASPIAGFIYLVFNPRFTWLAGSIAFVLHVVRGFLRDPRAPLSAHVESFQTRYWKTPSEYWHMLWNNVVLVSAWVAMSWALGATLFFAVYVASVSLAGAAGIVLFTVQHNFEHSYASESRDWDYDAGAIRGTSILLLPAWINWFTLDIAFHHVHHLSTAIPNYRLAACHREHAELFTEVTRIPLAKVPASLKCILWDVPARRIITLAEWRLRA
jgi:omega-6 fatty acid desaturase (delta-12 desaturase)